MSLGVLAIQSDFRTTLLQPSSVLKTRSKAKKTFVEQRPPARKHLRNGCFSKPISYLVVQTSSSCHATKRSAGASHRIRR